MPSGIAGHVGEVVVGHLGELVGEGHLLGESERHQQQALRHVVAGGRMPVEQVAEEIVGAHDGAGYQLREEADVQRVVDGIAHRLLLAAVHVHHVRHALKRVETDAQRKDDVPEKAPRGFAQQQAQIVCQEIVVLEEAQKPQVGRQAQNQ